MLILVILAIIVVADFVAAMILIGALNIICTIRDRKEAKRNAKMVQIA